MGITLFGIQLGAADILCQLDATAANTKRAHGHVLPVCACVDLVDSFFQRLEGCKHGTRFGDHVMLVDFLVRFLCKESHNLYLLSLADSIHARVGLVLGWPVVSRLDVQHIRATMLGIVASDVEWVRADLTDC